MPPKNVTKVTSDLPQMSDLQFDNRQEIWYTRDMNNNKRSEEHQRAVLELRRSNASAKFRNKKKYNRKNNVWKKEQND